VASRVRFPPVAQKPGCALGPCSQSTAYQSTKGRNDCNKCRARGIAEDAPLKTVSDVGVRTGNLWPEQGVGDVALVQVAGRHTLSGSCNWEHHKNDSSSYALQTHFDDLIKTDASLQNIIRILKANGVTGAVIGGWIRDHLVDPLNSPAGLNPHDIDLVVDGVGLSDLERILPQPTRRTVFGGFTFSGTSLDIDVWPLRQTYLMEKFGLAHTFQNVLAVTDFTINAALFFPRQLWIESVLVDAGCLAAIRDREIDFHFEWVPMPIVQAARLLNYAAKTTYALSEETRRFIRDICFGIEARNDVLANLAGHCPPEYVDSARSLLEAIAAPKQTRYFSNCLGVFEGGGVRASAFAGAYSAACEAGMAFSKLAGTSGGAIAASLIATGANPEQVRKQLFKVNLSDFTRGLDTSQKLGVGNHYPKRLLRLLLRGRLKVAVALDVFGGLNTSKYIETWIDIALHELLTSKGVEIGSRPVQFRDLPIPLSVVASNLGRNTPWIWSREKTPLASVAYAVRCSCTIPFFFQPVLGDEGAAYVDGGVLSNSPTFLFSEEQVNDPSKYSARILAFRLTQPNRSRSKPLGSLENLIDAVSDTVIDGGSDLQRGLQSGVYTVDIDTGEIGSRDFDKTGQKEKLSLFESGRKAVTRFVSDEREKLYDLHSPTTFVGLDQKMLLFVQTLKECQNEVFFVDHDSHWLYLIFPAFLAAARRGVKIYYLHVVSSPHRDTAKETHRQRLLSGLGATIVPLSSIPFRGLVADANLRSGIAAVTESRNPGEAFQHEITRTYSGRADTVVVSKLYAEVTHILSGIKPSGDRVILEYQQCKEEDLFRRLRTVPQYTEAKFSVGEIALNEDLYAVQTHIKEFKYLQIDWLVRDFKARGIELFLAQEVVLDGGNTTIVTPPVVEISGARKIILEGHTRAFHCLREGRRSFVAVIVDNVEAPPPTKPQRFADLTIASRTLGLQAQFEDLEPNLWRQIEPCMHPIS
jgi:predicted acylesterase/phospholipase RssA